MAFRELMEGLKLPLGASDRFRKLTALDRMLTGELYDDLPYSFETEKTAQKPHVGIRERRPAVDFCLPYEITQDTAAELFGDEQFPAIAVLRDREQVEKATEELAELVDALNLPEIATLAYEEGVVGSVAIVVHRADNGSPFYEVLPGKYCEPVYRSPYSEELAALPVTYPIDKEIAEELFPGITDEEVNRGEDTFWYRYVIGPFEQIDYRPLGAARFAKLGEKDDEGNIIEFVEYERHAHGFTGRTPAVYIKNAGGKQRDIDGMALWWPIRNICVEIDYTLSQAGRGLRYSADPMLFINKGDLMSHAAAPAGYEKAAGGLATHVDESGAMVKGATQVLVGGPGSDAKMLGIDPGGITEEREYVRDLREYALEVIGGMKARAEHLKGAPSGTAIEKSSKPLRRLVRRQRRPYGRKMLLELVDLTLYGFACGALSSKSFPDVDIAAIPLDAQRSLEWPSDDVLQGQELLYHVEALQMAAGAAPTDPKDLIKAEVMGAKLARDLGMHQSYATIKGTGGQKPDPAPEPGIIRP